MRWRGPSYDGELPTLGFDVLDWIERYLIVPDGPLAGEPLVLTREQAQFVLALYAIDPNFEGPALRGNRMVNGRTVRRAVLSRAKGWGKSPIVAALCAVEALAPVVPDGWNADGEPVGRPWASLGFKPKVQIVATSEDQTANTWDPLLEMMREGPVGVDYDIEALETFVNVPRGRIEFTTSAARSREGFRPVFAAMDQTESWVPTIGGDKLAAAIRRNLTKTQGASVETPNAHVPGQDSVAEKSFEAWQLQQSGKLQRDAGILFDHREAPADTDITDYDSLRKGLEYAYGDSTWQDIDRVIDDIWDPGSDPADSRRFWLNQSHSAADAWLSRPEWVARFLEVLVADGDPITLGFDGSRQRSRSVTDATALIACHVPSGHIFEPLPMCVWEQPANRKTWQVPVAEVDAAVNACFARYNVVGFFADPAKWESYVAGWEAQYAKRLKVKAHREHPIEWWFTGGRSGLIVRALEEFHNAVVDGDMTHDGSDALTRHVLNARRRPSRSGLQIGKEHPDSARKIDAAVAAVLAWQARLAAIAAGVGKPTFVPRRIR